MPKRPNAFPRFPAQVCAAAVAACFAAAPAHALPSDPTVVNGSATFSQNGNSLTVSNSNGAIINWQQFSIGAGQTTHFQQASSSSTVLNRVLGGNVSAIYGTLSSNGHVWLVNPAGIFVGAGGVVDVARFVASTLNVTNADFLANRLNFGAGGTPGDIVIQSGARIVTPAGGSVYLVGANVQNDGLIATPHGETILAAGSSVQIADTATPGVRVEIAGSAGNATNLGEIAAEAGRIGIAGVIVRNSGTLNASSVVEAGGRVFLRASKDAYVDGAGRIVTTGTTGGRIEVLGERVAVMDQAVLDASASAEGGDGGTVLVGGDYQGANAAIPNAQIAYLGADATIKANAGKVGAGGTAIVWADDTTRAYGSIEARGGSVSGDGGLVETSGKRYLDVNGIRKVDAGATQGRAGTWLLDPDDIIIVDGSGTPSIYGGPQNFFDQADSSSSTLYESTIQSALNTGNVVIQTATGPEPAAGEGNIAVGQGFYNFSGGNSLTLLAYGGITFGSAGQITHFHNAGALTLVSGWSGTGTNVVAGQGGGINLFDAVVSTASNMVLKSGGNVKLNYQSALSSITLPGVTGNAGAALGASGTLTATVYGDLLLYNANAASDQVSGSGQRGRFVGVFSAGNQTIDMAGNASDIDLQGQYGGATYGGQVVINSGAAQTITFSAAGTHSLSLTAGSGQASGQYASVRAQSAQSIDGTSAGGTLNVTLTGGSPNTAQNRWWIKDDDGNLVCVDCAAGAYAELRSYNSSQTIKATTLSLQAGGVSNGNEAWIEAKGAQSFTLGGALSITGGASGGAYYSSYYGGSIDSSGTWWSGNTYGGTIAYGSSVATSAFDGYVNNGAGISSDTSTSISGATSVTLTAGGNATSYAGAYIASPVVNISATGGMTMSGGTGASGALLPDVALGSGFIFTNPALIGWDESGTDVDINIGGAFSMTGGAMGQTSGAPVMIGSPFGKTVDISISADSFNAGSAQFVDRIGTTGSGNIAITTTGGTLALGSALIGTGSNIDLTAYGGISQNSDGRVRGADLDAIAGSGGSGTLGMDGLNRADYVDLKAAGSISYTSYQSFHLVRAENIAATPVSISTTASSAATYGGKIFIDKAGVSGATTVTVNAYGGIYDDNATGVVNVVGNIVTLNSHSGGDSGALAISSDVTASNTITAQVFSGASYGGMRVQAVGSMTTTANSVTLIDQATAQPSVSFYYGGNITSPNALAITANGPVSVGAGGNFLSANSLSQANFGASASASLSAGGTLQFTGGWGVASRNLKLSAGTLEVSSGTLLGNDVTVSASTLSMNSSGGIDAANAATVDIAGGVNMYGGAFISTVAGELKLKAGSDIKLGSNSYLYAGTGAGASNGNLRVETPASLIANDGSYLVAYDDVYLNLPGAASTIYLNETAASGTRSYIGSDFGTGVAGTTYVSLLGRSSGGFVLDGVQTTTTTLGGSGFYVLDTSTPAAKGSYLIVSYGVPLLFDPVTTALGSAVSAASTSSAPTDASAPTGTEPSGAAADSDPDGTFGDAEEAEEQQAAAGAAEESDTGKAQPVGSCPIGNA